MKIIDLISDEHLRRIAESKDTGTCRARIRAAIQDAFSERAAVNAAPASAEPVKDEAREIIAEFVRLADMGLEESLKEPEENGNFAAYERAKRFLGLTIDT